ncbi:DSE1 Protein DSE1 [Candida maltosa Xu316]
MPEYYEPTLLFRQNAIKRFSPSLSPISSVESLSLVDSNSSNRSSFYYNSNSSWLLNQNNPKDTAILNQSCALDRTNIKSNYWKIPDTTMNLTSMCINSNKNGNPIMAISSGNAESNLFIYELNLFNNHLIHHHTITLPNIYAMKWINNTRFLVTGNNKGYAHLVSTPKLATHEDDDDDDYAAEICKRFNHRKHLKDKKAENMVSSPIRHLDFINDHKNLLSIYNDYLFYWDIKDCEQQTRPSPVSITNIEGIKNFDTLEESANEVAICGRFGVSLFDLRDCSFNIPDHHNEKSFKKMSANIIKWNPSNTRMLAAGHGDGIVRLWDIRKPESYVSELHGHQGYNVTSIEWNGNDLFTGANDGNIIHWDMSSDLSFDNLDTQRPLSCGLKDGISSVKFNGKANDVETTINQRQCGTALPASNSNIVAMCSVKADDDTKIMSIDGSSFLGVHDKVSESFNFKINTNKLYYTEEDIQMLLQSQLKNSPATSADTLYSETNFSQDSLVKPLSISRKPTMATNHHHHHHHQSVDESIVSIHNHSSNDTLVNSPNKQLLVFDDFTFNDTTFGHKDARNASFSSVSSNHTHVNASAESLSTNDTEIYAHQYHKFVMPPTNDVNNLIII